MALLNKPKVLLLDEPFAALDVLTIKMLKELIVNLQSQERISICICDHQARDLLSCVDNAIFCLTVRLLQKEPLLNLLMILKLKMHISEILSIQLKKIILMKKIFQ